MAIITVVTGTAALLAWPFIVGSGGFTIYEGWLKHIRKSPANADDNHGDTSPSQESQDSGVLDKMTNFVLSAKETFQDQTKKTGNNTDHSAEEIQDEDIAMEPINCSA